MKKPKLSFWQIWNMSFGFLGIQVGFALQNGNVSRIFQTLGAEIDQIPILWIAAPVTGLIIQPIIGYMSDKTWGRLGRRRPYFLAGAIMASIALVPDAQFSGPLDGRRDALDHGCIHQYFHGTLSGLRGGYACPRSNEPRDLPCRVFSLESEPLLLHGCHTHFQSGSIFPIQLLKVRFPKRFVFLFILEEQYFSWLYLWTVLRTKEYSPEELESFSEAEG